MTAYGLIVCKGCGEDHIKETMYKYDDQPNPGWYCILCSYGIARRLNRLAREAFALCIAFHVHGKRALNTEGGQA